MTLMDLKFHIFLFWSQLCCVPPKIFKPVLQQNWCFESRCNLISSCIVQLTLTSQNLLQELISLNHSMKFLSTNVRKKSQYNQCNYFTNIRRFLLRNLNIFIDLFYNVSPALQKDLFIHPNSWEKAVLLLNRFVGSLFEEKKVESSI